MSAPIVALDTETTGLHAGRQAYDIAMIRRDDGGQSELQVYVDVDLADADPFALNVGRFWQRHPVGMYLSDFAEDVVLPKPLASHDCVYSIGCPDDPEFVTEQTAAFLVAHWTHGAYIIGSNPRFDLETLEALLRAHGLTPGWQYHPGDVACMAGGPPPWKLSQVAADLGVEPQPIDEQHTALGDARWALAVYDAIVGGVS